MAGPAHGIIRRATARDIPALLQLLHVTGDGAASLTASDLATMIARGHVLVLVLGLGRMIGAGHVRIESTGSERRAVFQLLAIHPAFAGRGIEQRLAAAMLVRCDARIAGDGALATPAQLSELKRDFVRRTFWSIVLLLALPGAIASAGGNPCGVALAVWSALSLFSLERWSAIPRAIVHRRRPRLHLLRDALLLRLGELPLGSCHHALPPITPPR